MAKAKFSLIIAAILFAATLAHAQQDSLPAPELRQTDLSEKYVKKVLFEAKWGDGPGEFQLEPMNEIQTWTTYLALDNQGNIYIADPNNYRINIFSQSGNYINTLVLAESDVIEKNKLPPENRGDIIQGIGVDSKGHIFVALSAFGIDLIVLELDKTGQKVDKYYFPRAWTNDFNLTEDKNNNKYLAGTWFIKDKNYAVGQGGEYIYATVPLSFGKINSDKNSVEVVDKIKQIAKQAESLLKYKKFKNGYSGYYSGSGDVAIKDNKGKIIFKKHHYYLMESHRFTYKPEYSPSVGARIVFDDEGSFFVVQGKPEGLEVLKYSLRPEDIK